MSLAGHPVPRLRARFRIPYGMHIARAQKAIDNAGICGGGRKASIPGHSGSAMPMQHRHLMSAPPIPLMATRIRQRNGGTAAAGMEDRQAEAVHRAAEEARARAPFAPTRAGESM